ncbi:MAG: hypothetical protein IJK36_05180 [Bacteroidales bacterium]|nr:hypothetical protein [Bacteroidales bacterium]MBR0539603.1 hypothetical protein [Bacteroidales bacterium]
MFWAILVGIVLTALCFVLSTAMSKKDPTALTYIVAVIAFVAFTAEGIRLVRAIDSRNNADNTVAAIQEAAQTYITGDAQNYRLSPEDASGVKIGLRLLYPKVAKYIDPDELAGHTIAESSIIIRQAVNRSASHRIWTSVLYMAITLVLTVAFMSVGASIGGGGSNNGYGTAYGNAPDDDLGF